MGAHEVDGGGRAGGVGDGGGEALDGGEDVAAGKGVGFEVGEDAGDVEGRVLAVGLGHISGAIDEPGGGECCGVEGLAEKAVGAAHPDGGMECGDAAWGSDEGGAGRRGPGSRLELGLLEHGVMVLGNGGAGYLQVRTYVLGSGGGRGEGTTASCGARGVR